MRILHVSNFGEKHNGRLFWNHAFKITNGFIRNSHSVYNFSDRDASRSSLFSKFNNEKHVSNKFIETFKNFNPDIILLGHADKIKNTDLEIAKSINKSIKIIEWNVDNYFLDNTESKLTSRSHLIDGFFITCADESIESCVNKNFISYFPNIFDKSIENMKIFNNKFYENDVFFALSHGVGTGKLRKKNTIKEKENPRVMTLNKLKLNLPDIKFGFYGVDGEQPVWASTFENTINKHHSGLCIQREPVIKYGLSDRISQYLGNGLMVYIQSQTKMDDMLKHKKEAIYYSSDDELIQLIKDNSNDIDTIKSIAKAGWEKSHLCFNERIVTNYFLDLAMNNGEPKGDYPWNINIFK
tara:strand:- start:132 stop:1193 length:1062 start_codon:yes stop_codon:yes gene_type:complete